LLQKFEVLCCDSCGGGGGATKSSRKHLYVPLTLSVPLDLSDHMSQSEEHHAQQPGEPFPCAGLHSKLAALGSLSTWAWSTTPKYGLCCLQTPKRLTRHHTSFLAVLRRAECNDSFT
jgi:hypothetical protein